MTVSGIPNKFEIFQDFYYWQNGVRITYSEALTLYSQMDEDTWSDFEQYYQDETGYTIISPSGYNLDYNFEDNSHSIASKALINIQYSLDAYAKENGLVLDPQWAGYSAEEIIQMENEGVNIPQDVLDIAHSIYDACGINFTGEDEDEDTTEKEPFLELIPKAAKKIKKCNETNDKIEDEVEDLLPETNKKKKCIFKKMDEQRTALKEYEEYIREWRRLQNKVNNGEALSDSEARRYAKLTGMLEDKNNSSNQQIDKREIARSLNEINILAALGEKLADETIEIGDTLADYTSKTNYKATRRQTRAQIGFIAAMIAMIKGKKLAGEAVEVGEDTKEYTEETKKSVADIASIMDIEGAIVSTDSITGSETEETPAEEKEAETAVEESETSETSEISGTVETVETTEEFDGSAEDGVSDSDADIEEDFIVSDSSVKELIKEAGTMTGDLAKQTFYALRTVSMAKSDKKFAKNAMFKINRYIKQYQEEEEKREEEIQKLEDENKELMKELEDLTGKSEDELEEEINGGSDNESSGKTGSKKLIGMREPSDEEKIQYDKHKISDNNSQIEELQTESEDKAEQFKQKTSKEKTRIEQAVPEENEALERNTEYKDKIIPEDKEQIHFTGSSGETLAKMGRYRVIVGMEQIAVRLIRRGIKNVAKGTISMGIGTGAIIISKTPVPKAAEKLTSKAVKEGGDAIDSLNNVDSMISSVTGEETTQEAYDAQQESDESSEEGAEEEGAETADGTAQGETGAAAPAEEGEAAEGTAAADTATDTTTDTTVVTEDTAAQDAATAGTNADESTIAQAVQTTEETTEAVEDSTGEQGTAVGSNSGTSSSSTEKTKEEEAEDADTDSAEDAVADAEDTATDDNKDSEEKLKDTEKDRKTLEKETKKLEKQMKKDEEEIIKMTQESQEAAKKQEELLAQYEVINAESDALVEEYEAGQATDQAMGAEPAQGDGQQGALASNGFTLGGGSGPSADDVTAQLDANSQKINTISGEFNVCNNVITRNRTKISKLQKTTQTNQKKFEKKTKIINKQIKQEQKEEEEKQKRLAKQLGIVGIQENVFNLVNTVGTIYTLVTAPALLANPFTVPEGAACLALGQVLMAIGTAGIAACGVAKAIINLANGNLQAALIGLGTTAVSVASSLTGAGGASSAVMTAVTQGLSIVQNSAELVNNVRQIQGKEASGVFSKISTIAGVGSAVTSAASSLGNMGSASTFGKVTTIASAVGTAMSSASQLMTEFGWGDEKMASMLGMIGGGIQTAASLAQIANSFANKKSQSSENDQKSDDIKNDENNDQNNDNNDVDNNKDADGAGDSGKSGDSGQTSGTTQSAQASGNNNNSASGSSDVKTGSAEAASQLTADSAPKTDTAAGTAKAETTPAEQVKDQTSVATADKAGETVKDVKTETTSITNETAKAENASGSEKQSIFKKITNGIKNAAKSVANAVKSAAKAVANAVTSAAKSVANAVSNAAKSVANTVKNAASKVANALKKNNTANNDNAEIKNNETPEISADTSDTSESSTDTSTGASNTSQQNIEGVSVEVPDSNPQAGANNAPAEELKADGMSQAETEQAVQELENGGEDKAAEFTDEHGADETENNNENNDGGESAPISREMLEKVNQDMQKTSLTDMLAENDINSPEMQEKMKQDLQAMSDKIKAEQQAQYESGAAKAAKKEKISKIIDGVGQAASLASTAMQFFASSGETETSSKKYVKTSLSKRSKDLIRKRVRRISSIDRMMQRKR